MCSELLTSFLVVNFFFGEGGDRVGRMEDGRVIILLGVSFSLPTALLFYWKFGMGSEVKGNDNSAQTPQYYETEKSGLWM